MENQQNEGSGFGLTTEQMEFIREQLIIEERLSHALGQFTGKWVKIYKQEVVASGNTLRNVIDIEVEHDRLQFVLHFSDGSNFLSTNIVA